MWLEGQHVSGCGVPEFLDRAGMEFSEIGTMYIQIKLVSLRSFEVIRA